MVEGACNTCAKYLLFAFNVVFVILGAILIIIGAVIQASVAGPLPAAIFVIIIGGIIFIVAFFGCCGAIKEIRCMLLTFAVLLVLILLLCVIGTIVGFVFKGKAKETTYDAFEDYITKYEDGNTIAKLTDAFQKENKCCGVNNYTDWHQNEHYNKTNSVPDSCCKNEEEGCGQGGLKNTTDIHTKGCISYLRDMMEKGYLIIAAVTAAVGLTMIFGIILAFCLASALRKGYNTV